MKYYKIPTEVKIVLQMDDLVFVVVLLLDFAMEGDKEKQFSRTTVVMYWAINSFCTINESIYEHLFFITNILLTFLSPLSWLPLCISTLIESLSYLQPDEWTVKIKRC